MEEPVFKPRNRMEPYIFADTSRKTGMLSSTLVSKEKGTRQVSETSLSFWTHKHLALEFYSFELINDLFSQDKINTEYRKSPALKNLPVSQSCPIFC